MTNAYGRASRPRKRTTEVVTLHSLVEHILKLRLRDRFPVGEWDERLLPRRSPPCQDDGWWMDWLANVDSHALRR
jgi:hypothetical protein